MFSNMLFFSVCVCVCVGELLEDGTNFLDSSSSSITEQGISISSTPISSIPNLLVHPLVSQCGCALPITPSCRYILTKDII